MSREAFHISDENPNDVVGGGGCVCSEGQVADCEGPFAIFYAHDQESVLSPHTVISVACAEAVVRQAHDLDAAPVIDTVAAEDPADPEDTIPEV